jgi:hypothetical protein
MPCSSKEALSQPMPSTQNGCSLVVLKVSVV